MNIKKLLKDQKRTGSFIQGFSSNFAAFKIISQYKGIIKYFVIPFILNIIILLSIFYFSYEVIHPKISDLIKGDSTWFVALKYLLTALLLILLSIITILMYSIIGTIVIAPFNDLLSQKVEEKITGEKFDEKFKLNIFFKDIIRTVKNIIKLLGLLVIIHIILLLLHLIPIAGSFLYSLLSFLMTSFFLGFQFFDFPLERRRLQFKEKLQIAWHYKFMVSGLGMSFFLISFIPVIGFLSLNLGTIGATTLFIDHIKPVLIIDANRQ